ncbi:MAG: response regulator, partial [Pseudomonadota bacterium]
MSASETARVLVVDDEPEVAKAAADWITLNGFETHTSHAAAHALALMQDMQIDIIVSDLRMPGHDGRWLLEQIRATNDDIGFVMLTGHGDVPAAVEAMLLGAEDFLEKPYNPDHLIAVINRVAEKARLRAELTRLKKTLTASSPLLRLFPAQTPANTNRIEQLTRVAQMETHVLLVGEDGTGRAALAHAMHAISARNSGPKVTAHAGLAESEAVARDLLFGGPRVADPRGAVRETDRGTLLLSQPEALPTSVTKLLATGLKDGAVQPPGFDDPIPINCRVIAWTHANREADIDPTLRAALSPARVDLPPLRERRDDIPALFAMITERHAARET